MGALALFGCGGNERTPDAVGVAGQAGSGTAGTGGGAIAGTGGGASAGTGGVGGAAGSLNPGAPEPRVLVVDPATDRFVAYDRGGQIVHDYHAELDFGTGFVARNAWVDWRLLRWDGPSDVPPRLDRPARGLSVPLRGSRILLRAENPGAGRVKVKVLTAAGTVENAFTVDGAWSAFQLSPTRQYIYATTSPIGSAYQVAAVLRPADGAVLWQKTVAAAVFAAGDERLVFVPPYDGTSTVRIKNLTTGDEIAPAGSQEPFASDPDIAISLEAALGERVVLQAAGTVLQSRLLYSMDWQGNIARFGSQTPRFTDEYLHAVDPSGQRVLWSSQANGRDGMSAMHIGTYEMSLVGTAIAPWDGTDEACFGRPTEKTFKLSGTALQSCNCSDGTCATIATLPASPSGWTTTLITNADRRTVLVRPDWLLGSSVPAPRPDILCYNAAGALLATIPWGGAELDDTGQIVLVRGAVGSTNAGQSGVLDLARGEIRWIGAAQSAVIVYE